MSIFKKKISDSEVLEYLEANPDFFINHPDILEILEIKHASGDATSLIEKQVEIIKEKNLVVSNKLSEFLENAEHNQNLFLKIQKLVLKINTFVILALELFQLQSKTRQLAARLDTF